MREPVLPLGGGRAWRRLATGAACVATLTATAPAASAHEVGLVVVASPDGAAARALDGFRFAVDQSPDVSHPPGSEGGDHLGGIDVDVTVVDRGARPAEAGRRVARAVSSGARIVVVLPPASDAREIVPRIRAGGSLIVVSGSRRALPEEPASPIVLLRERPADRVDRERSAQFAQAFSRRYGRTPDRATRRGYDAGYLLDRVLTRLGEGPFVEPALSAAVDRADRVLVGGTATVVQAVSGRADADAAAGGADDGLSGAVPLAAAGLVVTLIVGSLTLRLARRRRHSSVAR